MVELRAGIEARGFVVIDLGGGSIALGNPSSEQPNGDLRALVIATPLEVAGSPCWRRGLRSRCGRRRARARGPAADGARQTDVTSARCAMTARRLARRWRRRPTS